MSRCSAEVFMKVPAGIVIKETVHNLDLAQLNSRLGTIDKDGRKWIRFTNYKEYV